MNETMHQSQANPAYKGLIAMQDEALCHLFFHCCLRDGRFSDAEIDAISSRFVAFGLHKNLNFKDEVLKYRSYVDDITNEKDYVQFLIQLIKPANELALYSYCMELSLTDADLSLQEEKLLETIASVLNLSEEETTVTRKLMAQRKVVESQLLF